MIFRLTWRQLRRSIFESIVIWLQLFLAVLIITEVGTILQNVKFSIESVHTTHFDRLSFYQEYGSGSGLPPSIQGGGAPAGGILPALEQGEDPLQPQQKIMRIYSNSCSPADVPESPHTGAFAKIQAVDSDLTERTALPLSAGTWFDPQWDETNGYQALASTTLMDRFQIGEAYTIHLSDGGKAGIRVNIIGYLDRNDLSYPLSVPLGNEFLQENFHGLILSAQDPKQFGTLTFTDMGYIDGIINEDNARYRIVPMTEKLQQFTQREYSGAAAYSLLGGIVIALALFGICCSTIIRTGYDIRRYAVMSFCGARWRDCVRIELWKSLTIYLTSMAAVSVLLWGIIPARSAQYGNTGHFSPAAFWIGMAAAFLLYIPASLWKVRHTAKQNPIEIIRED